MGLENEKKFAQIQNNFDLAISDLSYQQEKLMEMMHEE